MQLSPNVLNYAQGFVPNAGEVLPIHPRFVETMLWPLIKEGYQITVVPVSYEVESEFLLPSGRRSGNYQVSLLHPIPPESVRRLVEFQLSERDNPSKRVFDEFLLKIWHEAIQKDKELTLQELVERAEYSLGFRFDPNWDQSAATD